MHAEAELVVNPPTIADDRIVIENKNLRRQFHVQPAGQFVPHVFQERKWQVQFLGKPGRCGRGVEPIRINADECDFFLLIVSRQLGEFRT